MWLQKDERKLLKHYYRKIHKANEPKSFELCKLTKELGWLYKLTKKLGWLKNIDAQMDCVWDANNNLKERGLINEEREMADSILIITLTLKGYDLGRKYNSWFIRTGLWFEEYKNHWLILILGFVAGILGALVVECLRN